MVLVPMLRTLDRYLIREMATPFALALLVFTFLLIIDPVLDYAEPLLAKGVPFWAVVRIVLTLVPQALGIAIPVGLLVGILVAFGRLSGDRETVALLAGGISLYRLLRPVAIVAAGATAATLWVMVVAIPDANQTFREITYSIIAERAQNDVQPRVFFEDFPGKVLFVRDVPPSGDGWRGVFLADTSQPGWPVVFVATSGRLILDRAERRVDFLLERGARYTADDVLEFGSTTIALDPGSVFPRSGPQRNVPEMTISQLQEQIQVKARQGLSAHTEIMALQQKFSIPVACLVFALLGLALGVTSRKDGKLAGFVVGLGVVFLYYILMYLSEGATKGQWLSASLSRWIPNLVLGPLGLAALVWRSRYAEGRLPFTRPAARIPPAPALTPAPETVTAPAGPRVPGRVVVILRVPRLNLPTPTILDRYLARYWIRIVAVTFAGLLGIAYIASFIDISSYLFKGEATGRMLIEYFWYSTPEFVYYTIPLSVLLATLATIGLLTRTSELTVMKACGISLYRAAVPMLGLAAVAGLMLFGLEESLLAVANQRKDAINRTIRGRPPRTSSVANRNWLVARDGRIYHYALYDRDTRRVFGLSVYALADDGDRMVSQTGVERAEYRDGWRADAGWVQRYDEPDRLAAQIERFEASALDIERPDYFETEVTSADMMTVAQLRHHVDELRAAGLNVVPHEVRLQRKMAFPFVTIIMTLLAVPFAVTTGRRGALYGIGLGIALALAYWLLTSLFAAVGTAGLLAPWLAAWAPNLLFGAGALYLILTVRT